MDDIDRQNRRENEPDDLPQTLDDDQFGTFTFDRRFSWYKASVTWAGNAIDLTLNVEEPDEIETCLKIARALWSQEASWKARIEDCAVQELLPLKNEEWLGENESELSPAEFKDRMTLETISIYTDGEFEFWHHNGDLFLGHAIQVCGNLSEGPTDADIPG